MLIINAHADDQRHIRKHAKIPDRAWMRGTVEKDGRDARID
jgi:hypothetical protein